MTSTAPGRLPTAAGNPSGSARRSDWPSGCWPTRRSTCSKRPTGSAPRNFPRWRQLSTATPRPGGIWIGITGKWNRRPWSARRTTTGWRPWPSGRGESTSARWRRSRQNSSVWRQTRAGRRAAPPSIATTNCSTGSWPRPWTRGRTWPSSWSIPCASSLGRNWKNSLPTNNHAPCTRSAPNCPPIPRWAWPA